MSPKHVKGYNANKEEVFDHELDSDEEFHRHSGLFMRVLRITGAVTYALVDIATLGQVLHRRSPSSRDNARRN